MPREKGSLKFFWPHLPTAAFLFSRPILTRPPRLHALPTAVLHLLRPPVFFLFASHLRRQTRDRGDGCRCLCAADMARVDRQPSHCVVDARWRSSRRKRTCGLQGPLGVVLRKRGLARAREKMREDESLGRKRESRKKALTYSCVCRALCCLNSAASDSVVEAKRKKEGNRRRQVTARRTREAEGVC